MFSFTATIVTLSSLNLKENGKYFMVKGCNGIKGSLEWGRNKRNSTISCFPIGQVSNKRLILIAEFLQ